MTNLATLEAQIADLEVKLESANRRLVQYDTVCAALDKTEQERLVLAGQLAEANMALAVAKDRIKALEDVAATAEQNVGKAIKRAEQAEELCAHSKEAADTVARIAGDVQVNAAQAAKTELEQVHRAQLKKLRETHASEKAALRAELEAARKPHKNKVLSR
jgi:chromosome segregation ATPase